MRLDTLITISSSNNLYSTLNLLEILNSRFYQGSPILPSMNIRVGLIYMIFLYQLGSWSSENMMSKDSKNGFGTSVAAIETHSKPLKVVASTVFYSIEAKHFLASKWLKLIFCYIKWCCWIQIWRNCHSIFNNKIFSLVTQVEGLENRVSFKIVTWVTKENFLLMNLDW